MIVANAGEELHRGARQPSLDRQRFVYGGVEFEVLGGPPAEGPTRDPSGPVLASVICSMATNDPATPARRTVDMADRRVEATWNGVHGRVEGRGLRACVRGLGSGRFVATATWGPNAGSRYPLPLTLAPALVERSEGLILHAAAAEVAGGAIAFVGPSGAGKTTALELSSRPAFALDKLVVARPMGTSRWWAWPLHGGSCPVGVPRSLASALPLTAIVRVERSLERRTTCRSVSGLETNFLLRESTVALTETTEAEQVRLDTIGCLAKDVPIRRLGTVLGESPLPLLQRSLQDE